MPRPNRSSRPEPSLACGRARMDPLRRRGDPRMLTCAANLLRRLARSRGSDWPLPNGGWPLQADRLQAFADSGADQSAGHHSHRMGPSKPC